MPSLGFGFDIKLIHWSLGIEYKTTFAKEQY